MHRQRCGLLAAWSTAWLAGEVSYDDVIDAVVGEHVHQVLGLAGSTAAVPLGWLLTAWREAGESRIRLVLPVPGDPRGLPGPGEFSSAAMLAGEGILGQLIGVVPSDDTEDEVSWTAYPVAPVAADPVSVAEAGHDLSMQLRASAQALTDLDVARSRPELAQLLRGLPGGGPRLQLPPGHDHRALRLLERSERLAAVLDLAMADAPGGAVSGYEARARDEALRPLVAAVRRALLAGYNSR